MNSADTSSAPRAVDGRVPGRRGRATRRRLLDATASLLGTHTYRDLKVVDIARAAGTSPATFYQYFPDVETAVLTLAQEMVDEGADRLAALVSDDWQGEAGPASAERLARGVLTFWDERQALIRVLDLASHEGDQRFRDLRTRLLGGISDALHDLLRRQQAAGYLGDDSDPAAVAGVLVSMLAHVAAHRPGLEAWGADRHEMEATMADILRWSITGA